MQNLVDDFQSATAQERFLLMLVERIGALEVSIGKIGDRVEDLHRCMTANYVHTAMPTSNDVIVTPESLASVVAAVQQQNIDIVVEHAWLVKSNHFLDMFLKLQKSIVLDKVLLNINDFAKALGVSNVHTSYASLCPLSEACFQREFLNKSHGSTLTVEFGCS
jgi:hypothetical protein